LWANCKVMPRQSISVHLTRTSSFAEFNNRTGMLERPENRDKSSCINLSSDVQWYFTWRSAKQLLPFLIKGNPLILGSPKHVHC
jgi:hypothetical protein